MMSPSTRRAWIEIERELKLIEELGVALHPEGVDRNTNQLTTSAWLTVALHPEGVDRNNNIESLYGEWMVALHPEGVDRNAPRR